MAATGQFLTSVDTHGLQKTPKAAEADCKVVRVL